MASQHKRSLITAAKPSRLSNFHVRRNLLRRIGRELRRRIDSELEKLRRRMEDPPIYGGFYSGYPEKLFWSDDHQRFVEGPRTSAVAVNAAVNIPNGESESGRGGGGGTNATVNGESESGRGGGGRNKTCIGLVGGCTSLFNKRWF